MKVTTCCGCWSLKTGTIIVGAYSIVLCLIHLIFIVMVANSRALLTNLLDITIFTFHIVGNSIAIGICTLLIIGALKKNTCLMFPWLILSVIWIIGLCVKYLDASIIFFEIDQVPRGVENLIFGLSATAIQTYLWVVVYNYRKEILIERMNIRMGSAEKLYNYQQLAGKE